MPSSAPPVADSDAPVNAASLLSLAQKAGARGLYLESTDWAQAALKVCPESDVALRAQIHGLLATHHWRLGNAEVAMRAGTQALALYERLVDLPGQSSTLCAMCMACNQIGLYNQALTYAFRALKAAQQAADRRLECWALNRVGVTYDDLGDHSSARRYLDQAVALARELGGREELFGALNNLARCELMLAGEAQTPPGEKPSDPTQQALTRARQLCEDNLAQARSWAHPHMETIALGNLADVQVLAGDLLGAEQTLRHYREAARLHGYQLVALTATFQLAKLDSRQGRPAAAVQALEELLSNLAEAEFGGLLMEVQQALYQGHKQLGNLGPALAHLERFSGLEREQLKRRADEQARVLLSQMEVDQARQETERARLDAELQRLRAHRLEEEQRSLLAHAANLGREAREDPLTGLGNRRLLDESLPGLLNLARSDRTPLALVMMDVDHFKRVNDDHGHAIGDLVLARLARLLMASTRTSDLLARIGGEEFIAVLVGTPIDLAGDICERLRQMVEHHPWHEISADLKVTISLGLVEVSDPVETTRLLALADKALYTAKHLGRNRVVRSV